MLLILARAATVITLDGLCPLDRSFSDQEATRARLTIVLMYRDWKHVAATILVPIVQ